MPMPTCPACGHHFRSNELRRTNVHCPHCRARLVWDTSPLRRLSELGLSYALDGVLCYVLGLHGMALVAVACLAWLPIAVVVHLAALAIRPRLLVDRPKYGDVDFHITGPPSGAEK